MKNIFKQTLWIKLFFYTNYYPFPVLENPVFLNAANQEYPGDKDWVTGLKPGNAVKAYPHLILDWHEIINGKISAIPYYQQALQLITDYIHIIPAW